MTTSTQKILNGMNALDSTRAGKEPTDATTPFTKPPSIPKPRQEQEMGEVLANCLGSEKKPGNSPR